MKRFLIALFFSVASLAHAQQPITISFKDQPLPVFLKSVYADILKVDYVMAPALSQSQNRVTLEMVFVDRADLLSRLPGLLSTLGVNQTMNGSAYTLNIGSAQPFVAAPSMPSAPNFAPMQAFQPQPMPAPLPPPDPLLWHVYKPSGRSPEYICSALFPTGAKDQTSAVAPGCRLAGSSVVFNLTQKAYDSLKPALIAVDQVGQRVEISTALAEVNVSNSKGSGLRIMTNILGGTFELGTPISSASALTFKVGNFSIVLDALGTDSRVVHFVSPSGVVDSGEKLHLAIGDRQPTLSGITTAGSGLSSQSVTYQQAGALLTVTPRVHGDGLIRLEIDSEVSTFSPTTTGITQSPTISQRKVTTSMTLQSGQVVVLGGLRSSKEGGSQHKLFGFGIGSASSAQTTDLVLLVHAKLLDS